MTGSPYKRRVYLYVRNIKKCMGIFKSLGIVNLYQVMSVLKLKINVNPQGSKKIGLPACPLGK